MKLRKIMKLSNSLLLILGVSSFATVANEYHSPLADVVVMRSTQSQLSIQNVSNETVTLDIYGDIFTLKPTSGLQYQCAGYDYLELQVKNNQHDYFEVPCQSEVIFGEQFNHQFDKEQ